MDFDTCIRYAYVMEQQRREAAEKLLFMIRHNAIDEGEIKRAIDEHFMTYNREENG